MKQLLLISFFLMFFLFACYAPSGFYFVAKLGCGIVGGLLFAVIIFLSEKILDGISCIGENLSI